MRSDKPDVLVVDAADAVTLNQEMDWDRCASIASPADRRLLDSLRALARLFSGGDAVRHRPLNSPVTPVAGGVFARRAVQFLMAIAAVEVAAALVLLPWGWNEYYQTHGDLGVYLAALLVGHTASASLLLLAGRGDRRTWLLGVYFLFKATYAPLHMLPAFWGEMPAPQALPAAFWTLSAPTRVFLHLYSYPFLFAPAMLWAFARECPRIHRRTGLDDFARRMVPISVGIGCAIWVSVESLYLAGPVSDTILVAVLDGSLAALEVLSLAAVVVVALRAHTAPAEEVRRVIVFTAGFLIWMGTAAAYGLAEVFSPGYWLSNYRWSPAIAVMQLARFPGMVLLWYAVLAARVPHPREVVRSFCWRLLMRRRLLYAIAATSAAVLLWLVASRPDRTVGAVLADPLVQSLLATVGFMFLLVAGREHVLSRLDAWIYPGTADQRRVLATVSAALAQAGRMGAVSRIVTRAVSRGCGSRATLLVTAGAGSAFEAPDAGTAGLPGGSAIAHMLETAGGALRVHPSDTTSVFPLLPRDDAAWVVETAADAIVAVPGPGGDLMGVLLVERRFDDRIVKPVDIPFLEAMAASAGLASAQLRLMDGPGLRSVEEPPAEECPVCGCVTGPDEPPGCDCGASSVETEVPRLLAGKYRLSRRLGSGGMGAVYLARDLRLDRDVAVKTFVGLSGLRVMGLRQEARAMATATHAGVAQIYGIEIWRGRPFLVVELLTGGTLADRLRSGPIPEQRAVAVTLTLADALGALHAAGHLHGDVKPSNIGFTSSGSPKLLDFGLARERKDEDVVGGTLHYLSPEVLAGQPADEADDIWSLCVVLHEMVAVEHPFAGGGIDEVAGRIRDQRLARGVRSGVGLEPPSTVLTFAASILTAPRPERPPTARMFIGELRKLLGTSWQSV